MNKRDLSNELRNALMEVKESMEGEKELMSWQELVNELNSWFSAPEGSEIDFQQSGGQLAVRDRKIRQRSNICDFTTFEDFRDFSNHRD